MKKTLVVLALIAPQAYSMSLVPYEPGEGRGCNWSGDTPAPDLVGMAFTADVLKSKEYKAIVKYGPSPYYRKGMIADQEPKPCVHFPNKKNIVTIIVSTGKSELEAAFVKKDGNGLVPYEAGVFGPVEWNKGLCVTTKGKLPIYDLGGEVTSAYYDAKACNKDSYGYRTANLQSAGYSINVEFQKENLKKTWRKGDAVPFKVIFEARAETRLLFTGYWLSNFFVVNPGFSIIEKSRWIFSGGRPRFQKVLAKSERAELEAQLHMEKDMLPEDLWVTFAFRNLWEEDVFVASRPVRIPVAQGL